MVICGGPSTVFTSAFQIPVETRFASLVSLGARTLLVRLLECYKRFVSSLLFVDKIELFIVGTQVGLLPTCNHQQLPFAYDMYKREDKEGLDMSHAFKKTYSRSVAVDFLGVW